MKSVSLDCPYNNEKIDCYSINNLSYYNLDEKPTYLYNTELFNIDKYILPAMLIQYKNHKYIIHNNIIYDYEKYTLHSILIKIGDVLFDENNNIVLNITRNYSNNSICYIKTDIPLNIPKDNMNKQFYGDIQNKHTVVNFNISGGTNDIDLIERMDNDEDNFDNLEMDEEDDFDFIDLEDDEISVENEQIDKLYSNNEIEIEYRDIKLNNEEADNIFKINDYIALYDLLTSEKY